MNTVYKYSYFSMSLTDRSLTCKPFLFLLSFIQVPIAFDLYELRLRKILLLCAKIFIFLLFLTLLFIEQFKCVVMPRKSYRNIALKRMNTRKHFLSWHRAALCHKSSKKKQTTKPKNKIYVSAKFQRKTNSRGKSKHETTKNYIRSTPLK